ncbi:WD40/YVTN/BNR-like repeat-containing protein [Nafulsella turpanensis]|uniref:WD40/YVTN/BNR-like repeat-containing protein n=1 Tax=Nafulsella turpanensis TaxID=1265690 RepID=UPI00037AB1D9|nr:hypothetical protein [Nafulsella turpanensis]
MKYTTLLLSATVILSVSEAGAQSKMPASEPSSAKEMRASRQQKEALQQTSLLQDYPVRSIGPVVQGARITDLAIPKGNGKTYYVAYASGGVFKTNNAGTTFEPVFDKQGALTIGDMALAPSNEEVLYVGTGEKNSSRSSYAGSGVYKTTDGGRHWQHLGLDNIQHTSRILVHPENPDIVWVAGIGGLYSNNEERGVFKSTDGGQSWVKTLYINDSTGIIDLEIDSKNPEVLYAAAWERSRKPWDFKGSGTHSGIYKSTDGGESWEKLTNGLPAGKHVGRIGLSVADSQPNTIYALIDNLEETKEKKEEKTEGLTFASFADMSKEELQGLGEEALNEFLKEEGFPEKYTAAKIKADVAAGKYTPRDIADYKGDANAALFETQVPGAEVYRSTDSGKSWEKMNEYPLEGVYYTYGYYFGEIRTSPTNPDKIFILGVPLLSSEDGGKTFYRVDTTGQVHVDHQALWIDPQDDEHLILGNDGGLYTSYDGGATWNHLNNTAVGQFYTVNVDMEKPYNVYGGLQDNGVYMGSSKSVPNKTEDWEHIMGGDGMYVAVDPRPNKVVYTGYQFGNYFRLNLATDEMEYITPQHNIGEPKLRFNWRTPVILSPHNPDIVYMGAQKVFRSLNQGDSWEAISPDLTKDLPQGNVPFSTITSLDESPLKFGLLYAGTDDGNVQVTRNGGGSWEKINGSLPKDLWVSSIQASAHEEGTVYLALNGYRFDDFNTYIYRSDDYGQNWEEIQGNLPDEAVNVLIEDPVNPSLLYAGTDHGAYISMNRGDKWHPITDLPNVAVYDMVVHPRENELVIGTHGRSIYIMDVKPLQKLSKTAGNSLLAFDVKDLRYSERWGERRYPYLEPEIPEVTLRYFGPKTGAVAVEVLNEAGHPVYVGEGSAEEGFNFWKWNVQQNRNGEKGRKNKKVESDYLNKGKYTILLKMDGQEAKSTFEIK